MSEVFDLSFLGLNGAIDAEVAQALFSEKNDITKIPASAHYLTDKKNGAALYNQARRIMKIAWDQKMRREGVKYFSGNLSIGLKQQDLYIVVKCSRRDEVIEDSPM